MMDLRKKADGSTRGMATLNGRERNKGSQPRSSDQRTMWPMRCAAEEKTPKLCNTAT